MTAAQAIRARVCEQPTAEYVLGLVPALAKDFPGTWEYQRRREWRPRPVTASPDAPRWSRGRGRSEGAIARLLRAARRRVCGAPAADPHGRPRLATVHGATTLPAAMAEADYVVLAAPLTQDTGAWSTPPYSHEAGGAPDQRRPGRSRRREGAVRPPRRRQARRRSPGRVRPGAAACRITPVGHARRDDFPAHGGRDHQRAGGARRGVPRPPSCRPRAHGEPLPSGPLRAPACLLRGDAEQCGWDRAAAVRSHRHIPHR